jgi:nicotinate-nucleotide adenylyltransferase
MKKIGLFGGTFNPIHLGHLRSAEEIRESFELDEVIFIPASDPPHKNKGKIIPASLRAEMVRLSIVDNPRFALSEVELRRPGKSYSVQTIGHFRQRFGEDTQLYFILGLDAFLEINTWKDCAALFSLCHFIVMTRPGFEKNFSPEHLPVEPEGNFCYDPHKGGYAHPSGFFIFPKEITALDISSTKIRENIQKGRSVRYLIPPSVEAFIYKNKLYQAKDDNPGRSFLNQMAK